MIYKKEYIPWNKGKKIPEDIKKRMYHFPKGHKINLGRKQTEEHRRKNSEVNKGRIGYWIGKKFSKEHKEKISNTIKKYIHTDKHNANVSKAKMGHPVSERVRKILSETHKGKPSWNKGIPFSAESRRKMSLARLNQVIPSKDTKIEVKIQNFLKQLDIDFVKHKPIINIEHYYQCDVFIPSKNLIIECDGDYWHNYPIGNFMDWVRNEEIPEAGYDLIRLWEWHINSMDIGEFKSLLANTNGGKRNGIRRSKAWCRDAQICSGSPC